MSDDNHQKEAERLNQLVGSLKSAPQKGDKVDLGEALRYVTDPLRRLRIKPSKTPKIRVTTPGASRVDPTMVAEALGAEPRPNTAGWVGLPSFDDFRKAARELMVIRCPNCRCQHSSATDYSSLEEQGSVRRKCAECNTWYHPEERLAIALMEARMRVSR